MTSFINLIIIINYMTEQEKAQTAQPEEITIFDRIVKGEIPATIIYQDD